MTILGNEILYYLIIMFHPKYIENAILSSLLLGMLLFCIVIRQLLKILKIESKIDEHHFIK